MDEGVMIRAFLLSVATSIVVWTMRKVTKKEWMQVVSAIVPFPFWIVGFQLAIHQ
ncbi:hypothetical protein [Puniceicoccus vermicola]|uniref:Uncharacterized protein n=1 Tax=Puniceicoccus vermicola TaxID=388746 RepID=A0A7X1AXI7_9BACT|nr:hypothetical protein [Puniceicoccus vermicola]